MWEKVILIPFGNVREEKGGSCNKREELNIIVLLLLYNYILHMQEA